MFLILLIPRRLGSSHLNDKTSHTPNICTSSILSSANHLRCHPVRCALHWLRHLSLGLSVYDLCISEISDLAPPIFTEKYIGSFDISVDYTKSVEIFETKENISSVLLNQLFVKLPVLLEETGNGASWAVFEKDIKELGISGGSVILHNVLITQLWEQPHFLFKRFDSLQWAPLTSISEGFKIGVCLTAIICPLSRLKPRLTVPKEPQPITLSLVQLRWDL